MCKPLLTSSLKAYLVKLFAETDPGAEFSIELRSSRLPTGELRYSLEDLSSDSVDNPNDYTIIKYEDIGLSVYIEKSQIELFSTLQIDYKEVEKGKQIIVFTKINT